MKIRDKLLLGFGLYILLAAILGFFAYKELRTIGARLTLVETADDITNTILEVRRYEKNFLLYKDSASLGELHNVTVEFEIIGGTGKVLPFVSSVDNGSSDSTFRTE